MSSRRAGTTPIRLTIEGPDAFRSVEIPRDAIEVIVDVEEGGDRAISVYIDGKETE